MTIRSSEHQIESRHAARVGWKPMKAVKAILGEVECGVGAVVLATPVKLPLHVFQQIIDAHRAGKKSRF